MVSLVTPESLRMRASAFPTGILTSTLAGETKLLPLSKVVDKLGVPPAGWISRFREVLLDSRVPLLDPSPLKLLPPERLTQFLSR